MHIKIDENNKRCEIWIENDKKNSYKNTDEYKKTVKNYRDIGYDICVFVGGNSPLMPSVTALVNQQIN